MKKITKITALLVLVVMTMGLACSCASKSADNQQEEKKYAELTIGLPYDESFANWSAIQAMVKEFEEMDDAKVKLVKVPEVGTSEYDKFIKDVRDNKIDLFLSPSNEKIVELTKVGRLASIKVMNAKDSAVTSGVLSHFKHVSREQNRTNYGVPFQGTYQALYLNKDIFEKNEIALPTDWATLQDAIIKLKEKGITPFAAGFADGGGYWIDEMVLSEGGIAEHSTLPVKGVITSWTRAIKDIKNFYNAGAFSASALTDTQADAVSAFINKNAAMIIANSADIPVEDDNITVMSFPKAPNGRKEDNAYIAKSDLNFYFSQKSFSRNLDESTTYSSIMIDFVNNYMGGYAYYPDVFDTIPGTFCFIKDGGKEVMDTNTEKAAWTMMTSAVSCDLPMKEYLHAFDEMSTGLADVLNGATSVEDYLQAATDKEIEADKAAQEAAKEAK